MAKLRQRYTMIDHENGGMREVGKHLVLNPAANPADYVTEFEYAKHVDPEMAASIREQLAEIDKYPDRSLSKYGVECLMHVNHPCINDWVNKRLKSLSMREKKILKAKGYKVDA